MSFYIEPTMLDEVLGVIDRELLPLLRTLPHFAGLLVLESDVGARHEVIGLSLWDGCPEESEAFARELVDRLYEMRGTSGTVKSYGVVRFLGGEADLLSDLEQLRDVEPPEESRRR